MNLDTLTLPDRVRNLLDDETARFLADLLNAPVGHSILDSGGAYGRDYQRNRMSRDLTAAAFGIDDPSTAAVLDRALRDPATLDLRWGYVEVTLDVWHWLVERVEYDPDLDDAWLRYCEHPDRGDWSWRQCVEGWLDLIGIDDHERHGVNTYNGEDWLSQVLQWDAFTPHDEHDVTIGTDPETGDTVELLVGETYVLLQVHGGADVRGGYSRPVLMRVMGYEGEYGLYDNAEAWLGCTDCAAGWHLTPHGAEVSRPGEVHPQCHDLFALDIVDPEEEGGARHLTRAAILAAEERGDLDEDEAAALLDHFPPLLTEDRRCPHCGVGLLVVDAPYAG